MLDPGLHGSVALIAGGGTGIGLAIASALAREDWFNSLNTNLSPCVWACREAAR
jgi:NAD(P)-dependent dehydrogenase (short-subunit alcohol dehydrogenase family)